ncbi:MAG: lipopolysaccharide core heptose(I) kinase RfaP [Gammaproteobacteria bacterium]|nr:lipopolysaccharide core heptose(I) kinase RfaP [Gammaproteobacteria bacterium]MCW5582536.1 lipopolysaccharide core heptose(I) kinase RfaP [Gammaproteobacteria bacterium]
MYLHNDVKQYLSAAAPAFDQLMALRGECFRYQEGRLTQRVRLGGENYFIKQHTGVGWKEIFKNLFQLRWPVLSAKNEKNAIEKLQSLGISVPVITGFGKRGINPARMESFIVMKELSPVISLEDLCKTWCKTPPSFILKHGLIKEVARIVRTLHQSGVNHRDLYICHFLLDISNGLVCSSGRSLTLYLIDLHRAQIRRLTPERWIIKDLSGLYFSSKDIGLTQRDLYRFIKTYTTKSLRDVLGSEKIFWYKVRMRGERLYSDHIRC